MKPRVAVVIEGVEPAPQGSKSAWIAQVWVNGKRQNHPTMRPTVVESSRKGLKPYRKALTAAFRANGTKLVGPVETRLAFVLPRPKSHHRTGKFAALLKPDKPAWRWAWPSKRGDLDKLTRAVHDALTDSGVYADDVQVCRTVAAVTWCSVDQPPSTMVVVRQLAHTADVLRVRPD